MKSFRRAVLAALLAASAGCGLVSAYAPPDWGYFDVVGHATGGIPATLGYYGGVAAWAPAGYIFGGILPEPVDGPVARTPGEILGTVLGLVLGAPLHLVALPFGGHGTAPAEERREESGPAAPR